MGFRSEAACQGNQTGKLSLDGLVPAASEDRKSGQGGRGSLRRVLARRGLSVWFDSTPPSPAKTLGWGRCMKPSEEEALLARLAELAAAPKSFDAAAVWEVIPDRVSARLCCTVALRIGGVLGGPSSCWR